MYDTVCSAVNGLSSRERAKKAAIGTGVRFYRSGSNTVLDNEAGQHVMKTFCPPAPATSFTTRGSVFSLTFFHLLDLPTFIDEGAFKPNSICLVLSLTSAS